jgi:hypothetical protein
VSDLTVKRGDTITLAIAAKKADGTAQSLVGKTLIFTAKDRLSDADPGVFQKAIGSGIVVDNAAGGLATVTIAPADTSGFTGPRTLLWDIQMTDQATSDKKTLDEGKLYVRPDVTRT